MDKSLANEMKELSKAAEKKGKILPVSKAFEMHPVEEEIHKGKIDYWQKGDNSAKH